MNLRDLYSMVSTLLGDPPKDKVGPGELLAYVNQGQNVVAGALWNIEREWFANTYTVAATGSTADYAMPSDVREIVRVTYAGAECRRWSIRELSALDESSHHKPIKLHRQYFTLVKGTLGNVKITIYPTPDDTSNIKVWYYSKPTNFHELGTYNGAVTTSTSTTSFADTSIPFAGTTGASLATFWADAEVRFVTGTAKNQRSRVSSWTQSSGTITLGVALTDAPGATAQFELDQVSIIPEQFHHLIAFYAAFLGASKLGLGSPWMDQFKFELDLLRQKWTGNIEATAPGVTPAVAPNVVRGAS